MERKIIYRLIAINFLIAIFIILDLWLPGKESEIKELDSIYNSTIITGGLNKPIKQTRSILLLSNGELYPIGRFPDKDYKKGQKLKIIKSNILNNVNEIIIKDNSWQKVQVGLFSNYILLLLFIISILISGLNIFINNKILSSGLIASMMYLAIISMVYIFYY